MKSFRGFIWVIIIIVALVLFKIFFLKNNSNGSAVAPKKTSTPAVNAMVIKPQTLNNVAQVTGSLQANEFVNLQPQVSGMITGLYFKEGDFVKKGTLLVKINDANLQAQLQKQQAALEVAKSNLAREEKLYKLSAVSESDYNDAQLSVRSSQADIEFTQAEIDNSEIRAPFDGVIGVRNVSPGAFVIPATIIATLYQSNPIKVEFDLPEKFASQMKAGTSISFTVQGNTKKYEGKVYVINPGINPDTRTLSVKALANNDGSLRPGSFANISIDLGTDSSALLVPTQALIPVLNGQQVFVAHHDTAFNAPVEIGIRNDTAVQITSGIHPGDTIITSGILFLRPKMKVQLKNVR
ncbi:MAG TPA: efflux RND transporter periplasmic adaptor subunit [Chitinophagales bacterium]|nr:efflux RND transporter periplasmic adaptor subunit [Chitinophagales bacterium]